MAAAGAAEEALQAAVANQRLCLRMVEAPSPAQDNKFGYIAGHTMYDICKGILPKAKAVVNIGTCACYGGVQAAKPNPTAAKGVNECFADLGVKGINIPGCPPPPQYGRRAGGLPPGPERSTWTNWVAPPCSTARACTTFANAANTSTPAFAPSFNSEEARKGWCLYEVGCKGPETYNNCPKVLFNATNWPVGAGHPCIGCSEPNFWDDMTPFYQN